MNRILLVVCMVCMSISVLHGKTIHAETIQQGPWRGVMPIHREIGQLVDPATVTHQALLLVIDAFSDTYSEQWYLQYVDSEVRFQFNKMHDSFLSSTLPTQILIGEMRESGNQIAIPLIILNSLQEHLRYEVILSRSETKKWQIYALSRR